MFHLWPTIFHLPLADFSSIFHKTRHTQCFIFSLADFSSISYKQVSKCFIIFIQIQNILSIHLHQNLWHILQNISSQFSFIIFIQIQNILSIHFHSYSGRSFTVFLQERIQSHHISSSSILKSKTFFRFIFIHILNDFPSRKKFKRRAKRHVSLLIFVSLDSYL